MSPHDVAVYGGLCALATFDRKDLHDKVLGSRCVLKTYAIVNFVCWGSPLDLCPYSKYVYYHK